ncbi:hypothetical protein GCM10010329_27640 [Streptomyces spiroverticillatus]|uniref:Uncharacterized protein n=1 Tax=Streptomyces finlayi TaxID=67296 RepID=A0A918WVK1_9ACTN|nr:hypothetical protein GCM10010329_27640 [Streptomyces spiroverticillatus]GHC87835.1 hypothetical protein GCM10010334_20050 [Streptomyces finlayi]
MHSGEYGVRALAGERKPEFDEHFDLAEPGIEESVCEGGKTALPGAHLRGAGTMPMYVSEPLDQVEGQ